MPLLLLTNVFQADSKIHRSVALKFAKTYPVALLARNPANYESIVREIKDAGGQAIGISTDVASESSIRNAFAEIQKEFKGKKLAAAIYNVGGRFVRKPFLELTLEEYEAGYEANGYTFSPWYCLHDSAGTDDL